MKTHQKSSPLSTHEVKRYQKQIGCPGFGLEGQENLKNSKVLIVGAGGLGTPVALYLASMGVGTIGLCDFDKVELSNLPRQVLYTEKEIGRLKVEAARDKLNEHNPNIQVDIYPVAFSTDHIHLIDKYDLIIDGTDQFAMRYLLNDICKLKGKAYLFAGIEGQRGMCALFASKQGGCYRCLFPDRPSPLAFPTCSINGVLAVLPGLVGMIQATEAVRFCSRKSTLEAVTVHTISCQPIEFKKFSLPIDPECPICSGNTTLKEQLLHHASQDETNLEISISDLKRISEDFLLLDVRTHEERKQQAIPNSSHIPLSDLSTSLHHLNPNKKIILYCRSGCRSLEAAKILRDAGFPLSYSLKGGILEWHDQ